MRVTPCSHVDGFTMMLRGFVTHAVVCRLTEYVQLLTGARHSVGEKTSFVSG